MKHSKIVIKDLELSVHLGATLEEQSSAQKIKWNIEYISKKIVCYQSFCQKLSEYSQSQKFSLLEDMASFCFEKLKKDFPEIQFLRLYLHKVSPPVPSLKGGVVYEYGDL